MTRYLAFYRVDNTDNYDRSFFNGMSGKDIYQKLCQMRDNGDAVIYDLNSDDDLDNFRCDYNDEFYDGGWWTIWFAR